MMGLWNNLISWLGLFGQLHWHDLVDFFGVAGRLSRPASGKKSGAVQILSGLGILAIAYMLSIRFELITFNYILEKFFTNLFLIVVILFQGEIRRALAQIGSNPFFSGANSLEESHMIEEITKGVTMCAQRGLWCLDRGGNGNFPGLLRGRGCGIECGSQQ